MSYKDVVNKQNKSNHDLHIVQGKELEKLKKTLLEIYLDIEKVCKENGLVCMLLGGSALGAIRHNGFIPWDDDLDIGMPRDDYEHFKDLFKSQLGDKYILNAPNYEGIPTNRFPKVLKKGTKFVEAGMIDDDRACIKVDIFVIENVPNSSFLRTLKGFRCTALMFIGGHVLSFEGWKKHNSNKKMSRRQFVGMLFSFLSSKKWFNILDYASRCNNSDTKFMNIPSGRSHYFGEILSRETFLPVSQGLFEGYTVFLPGNPHLYLKNLYGDDYMTLPPVDKREHHYIEKIFF